MTGPPANLTIKYENTIDDLVAFQMYHCENSPYLKRQHLWFRWGTLGAALVIGALVWILMDSLDMALLFFLFGIIFIFVYPRSIRRSFKKQAKRMGSEGSNKGILGPHEIEVSDQGLTERTAYGEQHSSWEAIERVGSSDNHAFIYTGPLMAHVIPKASVTDGDFDEFVDELRKRVGERS
jgi:YcxB-like protein